MSAQSPIVLPLPTPFPVGPVNVFLVLDDALTLIDTGTRTDQSCEALEAGLRAHGFALRDIERVLVTHHHTDHVGLLARIMEESGAESWGHPDIKVQSQLAHAHDAAQQEFFLGIMREFGVPSEIRERAMQLWDQFKTLTEPFTLTHRYEDGGAACGFRTWFVPGHSATDTLLVNEEAGYTIVGDHILEMFNPNPLLRRPPPGKPRVRTLVEYQHSLRRSHALDLGICYPGHGAAFSGHRAVIQGILAQHDRKSRRILAMAEQESLTPFAVTQRLYPRLEMQHLYLGLSVAAGQLELLEDQGKLRHERRDGVVVYSLR